MATQLIHLSNSKQSKDHFKRIRANALYDMAHVLNDKSDWDLAIEKLSLGRKLYRELKDDTLSKRGTSDLGFYFKFKGDYANAITYYTEALQFAERTNNQAQIGDACYRIGILYENQEKMEKAKGFQDRSPW